MRNSLIAAALLFVAFSVFKGRYRVLNSILSNPLVRKLLVQVAMQMPFIRDQFMRKAFR